ncbi:MAG: N-acetylmannosamine kinase [Aliivibrio sp.]|uniref:N-acetylmannosamine kinase n=1 Tax=Aliivibrio sp. TaxID=1872443 RepID=UPI001A55C775|nr:N-acetylmannosamine kinase [Aliivibrio sp.]
MKHCLAIDIGGTKLAAAIVKQDHIVQRVQCETPHSNDPKQLIAALTALLQPLISSADYVAVASTGIINDGVLTALNPVNLGGLDQFPLVDVLSTITSLPVFAINDAQAAAWAEYAQLEHNVQDMAFITVSTGVGAGVVLNRNLITGARGVAGHAGHMQADPMGKRCGCGRIGCVETIASGTAIAQRGKEIMGNVSSGKEVYDLFLSGDQQAKEIIESSAKTIANLIADLTIALDLDVVVLGGSVGLAEGYVELVNDCLSSMPVIYQPKVLNAQAGADAGLIGVALWSKQQLTK